MAVLTNVSMYLRKQKTPGLAPRKWYTKETAQFVWDRLRKFRLDVHKAVGQTLDGNSEPTITHLQQVRAMIPDDQPAGRLTEDLKGWVENTTLFASRAEDTAGHESFKCLAKMALGKIPGMKNRRFDTHFQLVCGDAIETFIKVVSVFKVLGIDCTQQSTIKGAGFVDWFVEVYHIAFQRVCEDRDANEDIDAVAIADSSDDDYATQRLKQRQSRERNRRASSSGSPVPSSRRASAAAAESDDEQIIENAALSSRQERSSGASSSGIRASSTRRANTGSSRQRGRRSWVDSLSDDDTEEDEEGALEYEDDQS